MIPTSGSRTSRVSDALAATNENTHFAAVRVVGDTESERPWEGEEREERVDEFVKDVDLEERVVVVDQPDGLPESKVVCR